MAPGDRVGGGGGGGGGGGAKEIMAGEGIATAGEGEDAWPREVSEGLLLHRPVKLAFSRGSSL